MRSGLHATPRTLHHRAGEDRARRSRAHQVTSWVVVLFLAAAGCVGTRVDVSPGGDASGLPKVENYDHDRPSVLVFSDGSRFETTLFDVRVLGALRTTRKAPYLILAGRSCGACGANTTIYIHSLSDGPMQYEPHQKRYSYPGRVLAPEEQPDRGLFLEVPMAVISETRTFVGDCLRSYDNAVVWFQRHLTERGTWEPGVFVASVRQDELRLVDLPQPLLPLAQVFERITAGRCRELPGVDAGREA